MDQQTIFVTKDMTVGEIIEKYPGTADIMTAHGLHCFGCSVNTMESVEAGAQSHGIPDDEIDAMMQEINDYISRKPASPGMAAASEAGIEITQLSADKINFLADQQGLSGSGLRISVVRGGCSGFMYNMEFEKNPSGEDVVIEQRGVRVIMDPESAAMLSGITIDYVESLQGAGFKIINPNEKASCGCGKSFK